MRENWIAAQSEVRSNGFYLGLCEPCHTHIQQICVKNKNDICFLGDSY